MKKFVPLVFFGTEDFSAASLLALIKAGWPIRFIVTRSDTHSGRGRRLIQPQVKQIGLSHNIEVLQPDRLVQVTSQITSSGANYGVLVAYGKIIPQSVIDLFPGGIVNVHPSLLPKYRGPAPIEAVILNGDNQTGISLMGLSAAMDAGPIYYQELVELSGRETKIELSRELASISARTLIDRLPNIISGQLKPQPQNDSAASYTKLIAKVDGIIDWAKPASQLEREVRAYAGWPKSQATIYGQNVIITKARVVQDASVGDLVMPAERGYLEILELIGPSGRSMSGAEFKRSYDKQPT